MDRKSRPRARSDRAARPGPRPPSGPGRARGPDPDKLLDIADELEEQARALLRQARQLQRMARGGEDRERTHEERPPRSTGAGKRGPRSQKRSEPAPSWTPPGKRRRP